MYSVERSVNGSQSRWCMDSGDYHGSSEQRENGDNGQIQWKMFINYKVTNSVPRSLGHVGRKGNHYLSSARLS